MGQSNSRARNSQSSRLLPPTTATARSPISAPSESSSSSTLPETSPPPIAEPPKRSRRARVRQSISNFVRPYTPHSFRARVDNAVNTSRPTWRNSKRISKQPPDFHAPSDSSSTAGPSTHPPSPVVEKDEVDADADRPPDFAPNEDLVGESSPPLSSTSMDIPSEELSEGTTHVDDADIVATDAAQPNQAAHLASSEPAAPRISVPNSIPPSDPPLSDSTPPQPLSDPSSSLPAPSPLPQQPLRPFPSPGTLVVVQGVVHTTDVPRSNTPTSTPSPQPAATRPRSNSLPRATTIGSERSNARNRLSALLRPRPSSVVSPRMSSLDTPSPPTPTSPTETPLSDPTDPPSPSTEIPSSSPPSTDASNSRPGSISSSSIEVLGTLLSVAAAATAASLLTGSSEPILSGGLAQPGSPGPNNGAASPAPFSPGTDDVPTSRPTSPTPTAGLGDIAAAGRAERLRQAWSSIRERLGLRPTSGPAPPNTIGSSAARDPTTDTRELMLAEMARAFNLGLGLNPEGTTQTEGDSQRESSTPPPPDSPNDRPSPPPLPAEGSFDRFLMDLQADLRVALTQGSRPSSSSPDSPVEQSQTDVNASEQPLPEDVTTTVEPSSETVDGEVYHAEEDGDRVAHGANLPFGGETQHGEHEEYNVNEPHEDIATGAQPSSSNHTEQADSEDALSRINWWRLYRFPPVETARVYGSHLANGPSNPNTRLPDTNTGSPLTTPTPPSPSPPHSSTEPPIAMASTLATSESTSTTEPTTLQPESQTAETSQAQPQPQQQHPGIVYPVIVVGLQSVNLNWRRDNTAPPPSNEAQPSEQQDHDEAIIDDAYEDDGVRDEQQGVEGSADDASRRRWGSRAANAFRNLRPGSNNRRNATSAPSSPVGTPGSRTFLIYVIGGYYPPDHSIVTGGPNNLDTFEALLELAELLGQVKPPTVTKEDIEKSGLEIIKPTLLQEYEQSGRIVSNCTERCLICLDDYDPEDDVRVMACRHAFHKGCVDTWLQTGKNNCPACRSKGVSNEPLPDAVPPPSTS